MICKKCQKLIHMLYVWYEVINSNTQIYATNGQQFVPGGVTSFTFPDNTPLSSLTVVNGIVTYLPESVLLQQSQTSMTAQLSASCASYITAYYPSQKQQSDLVDVTMAQAYLVSQSINVATVMSQINNLTLANYPNYVTSWTSLSASYTSYTNPYVFYWLNQALKAAYRTYFLFSVKREYGNYLNEILSATSLTTLQSMTISFTTPFPAGL